MAPLTIYKASAGSGKTYRLTLSYLELLFRDPAAYRHILAVTFTNKAASEMKSRILDRLYQLSCLDEDSNSSDLEYLVKETEKPAHEIIGISRSLLIGMLNDYSRFSVGTIDRFFQSVIRAFAREVGLPPGFILELDRDRILGEAVDRMFLRITEDDELHNWLMQFAEARLENEQGWNFRNDVLSLGKQLFSEGYQQMQAEPGETIHRQMLHQFLEELNTIESEATKRICQISTETIAQQDASGFTMEKLPGKSRNPAAYFSRVINDRKTAFTKGQKEALSDRTKWVGKMAGDAALERFVEQTLLPALKKCRELSIVINSVHSIRPYIYSFGILTDIHEEIREIAGERNLFLLSDAAYFLRGLVSNNPTPFVYEKTGNTYHHLMLDEFQDTSAFQWENFRPLLGHALAVDRENLVVGDIKQSIYRWRNTDWKILADEITRTFHREQLELLTLSENWRSAENVVRFNNDLFTAAAQIIKHRIGEHIESAEVNAAFSGKWNALVDTAYREVRQKLPENRSNQGGFVRCEVLADDTRSFRELATDRIPAWVESMQHQGYRPGDIAILVRSNAEGERVARCLMEAADSADHSPEISYDFVSNESLYLHRHQVIRLLHHLLVHLNRPSDLMNNLHLKYFYAILEAKDLHLALDPAVAVADYLPAWFAESRTVIGRLPLQEMVGKLIQSFRLDRSADAIPYIQAFQELILEQQRTEPVSLNDFLDYWKEHGHRKTLTLSEGQDAIRILTIHKAKGLEFKAVIIPFCDWTLTTEAQHETVLWCRTDGTIFSSLPVVPVRYRKDLEDTVFARDYLEETIMGFVDNLNLLYVALTRAEQAMIIGLPDLEEGAKSSSAGQMVHQVLKEGSVCPGNGPGSLAHDAEAGTWTLGQPASPSRTEGAAQTAKAGETGWRIDSYPLEIRNDRLRLRLKSADYFTRKAEGLDRQMDFGNMMHELLREVAQRSDLEGVVGRYRNRGLITAGEAEELFTMLDEKLGREEVKDWFENQYRVMNERDIIGSDGKMHRPDRVMISGDHAVVVDYKFGGEELPAHHRQVGHYMDLMRELGYSCRGFLWYVMQDKLLEIS